ncbi:MAG: hypothetical protein ABW007_22605 [Chitinophagaceae bacterium]
MRKTNQHPGVLKQILIIIIISFSAFALINFWPGNTISITGTDKIGAETKMLFILCSGALLGGAVNMLIRLLSVPTHGTWKQHSKEDLNFLTLTFCIPLVLSFYMILRGFILTAQVDANSLNPTGIGFGAMALGFFSTNYIEKFTNLLLNRSQAETKIIHSLDTINQALGTEVLDNYTGRVIYYFEEVASGKKYLPSPLIGLQTDVRYRLIVQFEPLDNFKPVLPEEKVNEQDNLIQIVDGNEVEQVTFLIKPNIETVRFSPARQTLIVDVNTVSDRSSFYFLLPGIAETEIGEVDQVECWIEISQKNRLVSVFHCMLTFISTNNQASESRQDQH